MKHLRFLLSLALVAGLGVILSLLARGSLGLLVGNGGPGPLVPRVATVQLGTVAPDEVQAAAFMLTNTGARPVKLIGSKTSCSCTNVEGIPTSLGPSQSREVAFRVATPSQSGPFNGEVTLYTDSPEQVEVRLSYAGEVAASAAPAR